MQENESILSQARQLQQERDQAMMCIRQRQTETQDLIKEIQTLKDREIKAHRELDRLRTHLLQVNIYIFKPTIKGINSTWSNVWPLEILKMCEKLKELDNGYGIITLSTCYEDHISKIIFSYKEHLKLISC